MSTLIEMAGGANLFGIAGAKSQVLAWAELLAAEPDVIIIIAPCGYNLDTSRREHAALARHPGWAGLTAVRRPGSSAPTATPISTARGLGWSRQPRSLPRLCTPARCISGTKGANGSACFRAD
jgi:hypothetical protein